ncbi:MAG: YvcK family protein [Candidatus Daviesbacteria bacterium]|nr:YvcK family protein [Candidatus Daviesbacteria bacterium]
MVNNKKYQFAQKVVTFGGGTGHFSLLRGLVELNQPELITAVVGTWDSGGSSGKLRSELGILPPGDIRQCLLALMEDSKQRQVAHRLFEDRLTDIKGLLRGHNMGNLIAARLEQLYKGADRTVEAEKWLFRIRANVLPVSLTDLHLMAKLEGGREIEGETNIDVRGEKKNYDPREKILRVYFDSTAEVNPRVLDKIKIADKIVFSAGDLYTSILPHLLVTGIKETIAKSKTKVILVLNLVTKRGETDYYKASDYLKAFIYYLEDSSIIDYVIVNSNGLDPEVLSAYKKEGKIPVKVDEENCLRLAPKIKIIKQPLAVYLIREHLLRHSPEKLAKAILKIS